MEEEKVNIEKNIEQRKEQIKKWKWQPGQSGNPNGRPPGKSLKDYTRERLANMTEEERTAFLNSINPETAWKMAEGLPKTTLSGDTNEPVIVKVIKYGDNDSTPIPPKNISEPTNQQ
jgi:hypothetical protein